MLLKKVEIYGFKSFADRIQMRFDKGITAIVGPNGSGKSNVADAVRWVLGEQSAKSLRGSRMEDVIFSGTQIRKPLGFAEVSLTFDNSCGTLDIEYTEVTITRRVFRSGESEYYINRSACRLKDIIELFMDTGVGKEGYSIIGQGRIDDILSSRSEDRRYIFEEAAGIVKYKSRREDAEKKLEKTKNNLLRVEDILSELRQQLEPLEIQSAKAKEYLSLREQLKILELNQFVNQYNEHSQRIKAIKEQAEALDRDLIIHKNSNDNKEQASETLNKKINELINEIDYLKNERHKLINREEQLKGELNIHEVKLNQLNSENDRLCNEIQSIKQEQEKKEQNLVEFKKLYSNKKKDLYGYKEELNRVTSDLRTIEQELSQHQIKIDETKSSIIDLLNKISEHKNNITRYRTMSSSFSERLDTIKNSLVEIKEQRTGYFVLETAIKKDLEQSKSTCNDLANKKDKLIKVLQSQEVEISAMESELQKHRQLREGSSSKLSLLLDMKKGYEGFHKSVRAVLTACRQNKDITSNVYGVVADLIRVPKEYELATETALGSALQHIVTQREEDAKILIEYLRKNQLGRATFLPVSSVRGRYLNFDEQKVLRFSGCRGIASQLIECDAKFTEIINNLLGRVVIAEDMDCAIEMARKFSYSFRIVTMAGDVLNPGGSMTGGSRQSKSISILGRNRQINELNDQITDLNKKITDCENKLSDLKTEYNNNKRLLEITYTQLQESEIAVTKLMDKLDNLISEAEQLNKEELALLTEESQINANLKQLEEKINNDENELKYLETMKVNISENVSESELVIKEKTEKKEKVSQMISDIRVKEAALESELHAINEDINNIVNELSRYGANITSKEEQIEENKKNIEILFSGQEKGQTSIIDIQERIKEIEASISHLEDEKGKTGELILDLESEIKESLQTLNELKEKKHGLELQLSRLETELENFQNNIWNEYGLTYAGAMQYCDASIDITHLNQNIKKIKESIISLGDVNVNAIEEHKRVSERFMFLTEQKQDLINAKENLDGIIKDITKKMEDSFRTEFEIINKHFNEVFRKLFDGGYAKLVLQDKNDILSCGIDIIAQPPGKKLQNLSLLSGGEKAMTAIAILFAILKHKPTPFCVLDEIDAALDESNVVHFGRFIREFSANTQFIIITHRKGTMEVCDVLYGIAMEEKGISKLISVKFEENAG